MAIKDAEINMLRAQLEERGSDAEQKITLARESMIDAEKEANNRVESEYSKLLEQKESELAQERELRTEFEFQLERIK